MTGDLSQLTGDGAIELSGDDRDWRSRAEFRARSRRSLFYFTKTAVCAMEPENLMTARSFKESSDWLQWIVEVHKRGLFEDPRDHIKSYRSTVAIPLWIPILVPDEEFDHPNEVQRALRFLEDHPHLKGADMRIAIGSESKDRATDWVRASKMQWDSNQVLRWAFPEVMWPDSDRRDYGRWSDEEYHLPRRKNLGLPDGYLRSVGIESKETGGRADAIIIDDLNSEKSVESPSELAYRTRWFKSITQLLDKRDPKQAGSGFVLLVTNRWALDDTNSHIHDEMAQYSIWHRAAHRCIVHDFGNCGRKPSDREDDDCGPITGLPTHEMGIWPEKHPDLDAVRADLGDDTYAAQWENDPTKRGDLDAKKFVPFRLEVRALSLGGADPRRMWCAINDEIRDETGSIIVKADIVPIRQLALHHISIDPAGADEESEARKRGKTARWAITWDAFDKITGRHYVLDCRAHHWPPDEAITAAFDTWNDCTEMLGERMPFICEKVAAQTLVGSALRFKFQAEKMRPPQVEMMTVPRGLAKYDRTKKRLGNRLGQYRLYLREGLLLPRTEARHAPTGTMDTLDAISQAEAKFLEAHGGHGNADANRAKRKARRRRARMSSGRTGVPLG